MRDTRERPVCHRAEDLVTYLYGEASEAEALDFGRHLQQCDACRSEFAGFDQVHESIKLWRKEALGVSLNPAAVVTARNESRAFVRHERKLSAMAALREFFNLSPLWLRGATAFAALLLFVLGVVMVARVSRKPAIIANVSEQKTYTRQELEAAVKTAIDKTRQELAVKQDDAAVSTGVRKKESSPTVKRPETATVQPRTPRPRNLNRQEREQLAADLRLTSAIDDDELLLALPEQDLPHQ